MGRAADLTRRRVELECQRGLGDQIGRVGTDDVDPQRVARERVADDLREALVLAADERLGDRLERDLANLVRDPLLLALLLGKPDRGDLRPAVGRPRLLDVVDLVDIGIAGDRVGGDDPLVSGGVREPSARR